MKSLICMSNMITSDLIQQKIFVSSFTGWGEGINPNFFVSSLYISVAIKASLLKFNVFNIHKKQYF